MWSCQMYVFHGYLRLCGAASRDGGRNKDISDGTVWIALRQANHVLCVLLDAEGSRSLPVFPAGAGIQSVA